MRSRDRLNVTGQTITGGKTRFGADRRLRSKKDFDRVFQKPVRSADGLFTVLARPVDKGPRLGLAISVRAAGNAACRNRVKRLVRESFRLNQESMAGADIVVMAKPGIGRYSNTEIHASLRHHWERIRERCVRSS